LVLQVEDPVVILGFGPQGQMLANMLASPLAQSGNKARAYIGFDLDHARVTASRRAGFNVAYGNGARPGVLKAAGVVCEALRQVMVVSAASVQLAIFQSAAVRHLVAVSVNLSYEFWIAAAVVSDVTPMAAAAAAQV
jgi:hypothetical protein